QPALVPRLPREPARFLFGAHARPHEPRSVRVTVALREIERASSRIERLIDSRLRRVELVEQLAALTRQQDLSGPPVVTDPREHAHALTLVIVPVFSVPPVQSHHPPRGEPLARVRHPVHRDTHGVRPTTSALPAGELALLELRGRRKLVPVAELGTETDPALEEAHLNDPPWLAAFDDAEAHGISR